MAIDAATRTLTYLAIILLIGLLISIISKKMKVSNILLLILTGIGLGKIAYRGSPLFDFSSTFLIAIGVMTLVMVVFDGASRFELQKVDRYSVGAIKLSLLFVLFNIIFISFATVLLFFESLTPEIFLLCLLFAILISGTDPGSVLSMFKTPNNRVIQFLEIEAIVNTPLIVIFPLVIVGIVNKIENELFAALLDQIVPLLQQVIVGIGTGILLGVIVHKAMKRFYSRDFSHVGLITATLLAYIIAENLDGSGVLSVATLGLYFGNVSVKHKATLQEFNSILGHSMIIVVFVLMGFLVPVQFSLELFFKALVLFGILVFTRMLSIQFTSNLHKFNNREKLFMALSMPKGIAVAVVVFSLTVFPLAEQVMPAMATILQLTVFIIIYSLVCSTCVNIFSDRLIGTKLQ